MRVVVVGASSGLGRCIGTGLAASGAEVALLGRRTERLEDAAAEAGTGAIAVQCDVTDADSCVESIRLSAEALGGIDGLVYSAGLGPLTRLVDTDATTWRSVFDTNVVGAALITAAALPHLSRAAGTAVYLSSVSASLTPPWPGLGAYAVSKAALDKLVEAWRIEHPDVGFTRLTVGDCAGGTGDSTTGFASGWDAELAAELMPTWIERGYVTGALLDVGQLVAVVAHVLRSDPTACIPVASIGPRQPSPDRLPASGPTAGPVAT